MTSERTARAHSGVAARRARLPAARTLVYLLACGAPRSFAGRPAALLHAHAHAPAPVLSRGIGLQSTLPS
jgi:hypothetical protein